MHILEACVAKQVNGLTRRAQAREDTFGYQRYRACNLWVSSAFKIDDGQFGSLYNVQDIHSLSDALYQEYVTHQIVLRTLSLRTRALQRCGTIVATRCSAGFKSLL